MTENKFIQVFSDWLNPEKPTVILCRNVVDIMRLRIYFHEKGNSFFNVHFLTMDQWINKLLPLQNSSEKIIHSKLAEKALIFQNLNYLNKKDQFQKTGVASQIFLDDLLKLPGFKGEILYLWHLYSWNRQTQPGQLKTEKENSLSSELFHLFNNVYEDLSKKGLIPLPELYTSSPASEFSMDNPDKEFQKIQQVICMYPTDFNIIERIKMNFLIRENPCHWKFVFNNDSPQSNASAIIKSLQVDSQNSEVYFVNSSQYIIGSYDEWQISNRNFFINNSENKEMKIWMCKNQHDEFQLMARSIRTLYDRGIPLQSIFILYCSSRELPLLEYYLNNLGLNLNQPEKYSAATRSILSIATDLIELLALRIPLSQSRNQPGFHNEGQISRNQLIELIMNPNFWINNICDTLQSREKLAKFIHEKYDIVSTISLESLIKAAKIPSENSELISEFTRILEIDRNKLSSKAQPSGYSALFMEIFKKYISKIQLQPGLFDVQIDSANKVCESFYDLDRFYPEGMDPEFYYSLLYDELSGLKLKTQIPFEADNSHEDLPEVYARSIQEGVHSPVDYLFICGLTSKAFPSPDRHPDFLETTGDDIKFTLNLSASDQKGKIRDSLNMVRYGYCLTFNLQSDPAPSEFIFEQIPGDPQIIIRKEKLLSDLPFYERKSETEMLNSTGAIRTSKSEEIYIPDSIYGINQYPEIHKIDIEDSLNKSFISKFVYHRDRADEDFHQNYTGMVRSVINEKISSAGNIENFAWCPQLFWFDKIQKLAPPLDYYDGRYLEKRHTGTLFHTSAKNLVSHLIENFPGIEYCRINKSIPEKDMNPLLQEMFDKAKEIESAEFKTDFEIFTESVLQSSFDQFSYYFKRFFYLAEKERHPLFNYYPLAVEKTFENISLGMFDFKGRIDRIDYLAEKKMACVLDYKTGNSSKLSFSADDIRSLGKFQLPLYIKAVCEIVKQNDSIWPVVIENIQAAYEFTAEITKSRTLYFMEIDEGTTIYPLPDIERKLASLLENGLQSIREILASGYFFSYGHKKTPDGEWESKCRYCNYAMICDRAPYGTMIQRLNSDPVAGKFLSTLYPQSS